MNIYPKALNGVSKIVSILEQLSQAGLNDDDGVVLGSMPLYTSDGRLIGAVNVDDDEHVYFTPSEDDYDEDEPGDGETEVIKDATISFFPASDFAPTVAQLTRDKVG